MYTCLAATGVYAQTARVPVVKETTIGIKLGTAGNFINKGLYRNLNANVSYEKYKPGPGTLFFNPYASVGVEHRFFKHIGIQLNLGFYQTLQEYNATYNLILSANIAGIGVPVNTTVRYLSNNVFMEILPEYVYKHTRVVAGINVTRCSPTANSKINYVDNATQITYSENVKDRLPESYHLYSIVGIQQGFPVKTQELMVSLTYFGLAKKFDSGFNLTFGFLF